MHIQSYKHGTIKNVSLGISFVVGAEEAGKIKTDLVIPHATAPLSITDGRSTYTVYTAWFFSALHPGHPIIYS